MIKLEKVDENAWCFKEPTCVKRQMKAFHAALDKFDNGDIDGSEDGIRLIIKQCPDFIDAIHHLALIADMRGMDLEYFLLEKEAVSRALEHAPADFSLKQSRLDYGCLENRPFLRAYHGLGIAYFHGRELKAANEIFNDLISLCPNDNLGARELIVETSFMQSNPKQVLAVCDNYPDDTLVSTLYGHPLAMIQLGKPSAAKKLLRNAVKDRPLVAKALLTNIQLVQESTSGYFTVGGEDEAFEYRRSYGVFWRETPGALDMLKEVVNYKDYH